MAAVELRESVAESWNEPLLTYHHHGRALHD